MFSAVMLIWCLFRYLYKSEVGHSFLMDEKVDLHISWFYLFQCTVVPVWLYTLIPGTEGSSSRNHLSEYPHLFHYISMYVFNLIESVTF